MQRAATALSSLATFVLTSVGFRISDSGPTSDKLGRSLHCELAWNKAKGCHCMALLLGCARISIHETLPLVALTGLGLLGLFDVGT